MTRQKNRICIVIPAYNESQVIYDVLTNIKKALARDKKHSYEIVVVNDGSADDTSLEAKRAKVTVIDHILNSGAGGATATGLSYAQQHNFDAAATMDADGQHKPEDLVRGVEKLLSSDVDLLIGSRLIDSKGMSRVKVLGNKGLSAITYLIFGINSTDSQSGLRVFSKKALACLEWKARGYEFCSEMLWRASKIGLKIDEYPIYAIYTEYSKSKGQSNWNGLNIVRTLLARRLSEIFR